MVSYGEKRRLVKKPKSGVERLSVRRFSPENELYAVDLKRVKKAAGRNVLKDSPAKQKRLVSRIIEAASKVHKPYHSKIEVTLDEDRLEAVCRELKVSRSYLRPKLSNNQKALSIHLEHSPDYQIVIKGGSSKRKWSIVDSNQDDSHGQDPPTIPPVIRRRK